MGVAFPVGMKKDVSLRENIYYFSFDLMDFVELP
jgi:hypothetical protein